MSLICGWRHWICPNLALIMVFPYKQMMFIPKGKAGASSRERIIANLPLRLSVHALLMQHPI